MSYVFDSDVIASFRLPVFCGCAITNINDNAQVISSGLDQSSAALTEVTRTVNYLQQQADELKMLVDRFVTQ
ncbi:hypothetical protein [Seleniivibrio sp.]|uniref:hypothetical protein n=1 Tax=Seleniivibrio sp. TaxID=2898801 RepID=UPI0025E9BF1C|nr:hypothetical protein [Seleniivibrio sp.]MCD8553601.1 hypothetical protein [Seleniivibrio sp.]